MPVQEDILELLKLPAGGSGAPTLARLEDTLTEGYAEALALEGERWRIERRIGEIARAANGDGARLAEELSSLSEQLRSTDGELSRLRDLLGTLHARARTARLAHS
jgi:hypothetical protein